jgi:hypothetical protein
LRKWPVFQQELASAESGGDEGHHQARADAWPQVGNCSRLLGTLDQGFPQKLMRSSHSWTVVGITASFNGVSQTIPLTVQPPTNLALLSLTITPVNVAGGSAATGTVTLTGSAPNGGADVSLVSDNASVVSVASHVTVRKGDTTATFAITTFSVTATQSANVSGSYGGLTQHDTLTVIPASAVQLTNLTITPNSVSGGTTATGTVTMSSPAPTGGLLVSLASRHRNFATVPAGVTVPGGATTASFAIAAQAVKSTHTVDLTATYASVTKTAQLTVTKSVASLNIFGRISSLFRHVPLSLSVSTHVAQPLATGVPSRYSLYTPELNLMTETETTTASSPAITYEYVWFAGQPAAQFDVATNTAHWTFTDHLGTPVLQTNTAGAVDWRAEYDPYGTVNTLRAGAPDTSRCDSLARSTTRHRRIVSTTSSGGTGVGGDGIHRRILRIS